MCQIALSNECLTVPSARLWPRLDWSRWYCAAGVVGLHRMVAIAASSSAKSSHFDPARVLPERRLPADWSLPGIGRPRTRGDAPTQSATCRRRSRPGCSCAPRRWIPTTVHNSTNGRSPRRAPTLVFRQRQLTDSGEHAAQRHGAVFGDRFVRTYVSIELPNVHRGISWSDRSRDSTNPVGPGTASSLPWIWGTVASVDRRPHALLLSATGGAALVPSKQQRGRAARTVASRGSRAVPI